MEENDKWDEETEDSRGWSKFLRREKEAKDDSLSHK